jgi:hypothetical protein
VWSKPKLISYMLSGLKDLAHEHGQKWKRSTQIIYVETKLNDLGNGLQNEVQQPLSWGEAGSRLRQYFPCCVSDSKGCTEIRNLLGWACSYGQWNGWWSHCH